MPPGRLTAKRKGSSSGEGVWMDNEEKMAVASV